MARFSPFIQAATLALTAYFLFSIADISSKMLSLHYAISLCTAVPAFIALVGIGIRIVSEKGWKGFQTPNLKIQLARSVVITLMVILCVNALKTVPIADFYCIIFLSPFFVMLASHFVFHEPFRLYRVGIICLAFLGVIVTIGPHFDNLTLGYALVALSLIFSSANIILVRKIKGQEYAPLYAFYPLLLIFLVNLPFALQSIPTAMPPLHMGMFLLYGLSLIGAHTFLPMAYTKTPEMSLIAPFHYSQMLWGILSGIIIFGNEPQITTFIGGGIILSAGAILLWKEKHQIRKPKLDN